MPLNYTFISLIDGNRHVIAFYVIVKLIYYVTRYAPSIIYLYTKVLVYKFENISLYVFWNSKNVHFFSSLDLNSKIVKRKMEGKIVNQLDNGIKCCHASIFVNLTNGSIIQGHLMLKKYKLRAYFLRFEI